MAIHRQNLYVTYKILHLRIRSHEAAENSRARPSGQARQAGSARAARPHRSARGRPGQARDRLAADHHSRRARAQSEERGPHDPARSTGRVHGTFGVGQVVARLRHDLCGGTAPLCGVALGLRPPVSGDDAEAGRRSDRRPVARHFHRAEDHFQKPALHGGHGHRDPRLHAPFVGAGGRALFPRHRPAHREPDGEPDGGPGAGPARAHAPVPAGPRHPGPQGRVSQGNRRLHEARLPAPEDRRRISRHRRRARAGQEAQARHRRGGGPHRGALRHRRAAGRFLRNRAGTGRRHLHHGICGREGSQGRAQADHLLLQIRLPRLRLHDSGGRAPAVLLQQSLRRLPDL